MCKKCRALYYRGHPGRTFRVHAAVSFEPASRSFAEKDLAPPIGQANNRKGTAVCNPAGGEFNPLSFCMAGTLPRLVAAITRHHPIAQCFIREIDCGWINHELLLPGILKNQFQAELEILEFLGAQVAHPSALLQGQA